MSLREIELIPTSRFKGKFKGDKVVVSGWYDNYKWSNEDRHRLYKRITKIIQGSVGKRWDDIYSKLSHMVRDVPYDIDIDSYTNDIIIPYWDSRRERWYGVRWRNYHFDLFDKVKSLKSMTVYGYYSFDEMYWVCPYTGILKYVRTKKAPRPSKVDVRANYEKIAKRRRDRKEYDRERRQKGLPQLAMINRPDLFGFYNRLIARYKELDKELWRDRTEAPPKYEPVERYYNTTLKKMVKRVIPDAKAKYFKRLEIWKAMNGWRKTRIKEIKEEMARLKPQIEALERGEFNIFFESNVYLYSIQKECHHF